MAYEMKGSPMQRNFGISPVKDVNKSRKMAEENKPDTSIKESNYRAKLKTIEPDRNRGGENPKSKKTNPTKPPAGGEKSKGTLRGVTQFESDFPKASKLINLQKKVVKKGINTAKNTGKKIKDYFTKK